MSPGQKIEYPKQQIRRDINCVTLGNIATLLVQKLKIQGVFKNRKSKQIYWPQISFLNLSFWANDVINFPTVTRLIFIPDCHFRFSIFLLETLKFECNVVSTLKSIRPLFLTLVCFFGGIHWVLQTHLSESVNIVPLLLPPHTFQILTQILILQFRVDKRWGDYLLFSFT